MPTLRRNTNSDKKAWEVQNNRTATCHGSIKANKKEKKKKKYLGSQAHSARDVKEKEQPEKREVNYEVKCSKRKIRNGAAKLEYHLFSFVVL